MNFRQFILKSISFLFIFQSMIFLSSCGKGGAGIGLSTSGGGDPASPTSNLILNYLNPNMITAGGGAFTLTATGSGFVTQSVLLWNGSMRPTTYISSTQLTAQISANDIVNGGIVVVTISNLSAGSGTSNAVNFLIRPYGIPVINHLSPASVLAGGGAFILSATGSGFVTQSVLLWNGSVRSTTYISSTQLTAQISANDIVKAGTVPITVSNSSAGGGTSNPMNLVIQSVATLSLNRVSPTLVTAGGQGFVITAIGTGFSTGSVLQWNGSARPTTYVSPTELTAQITDLDIAVVGSANVTISNSGSQSGVSSTIQVSISAPSIDAVAFQIDPSHSGVIHFNNVSLPTASRWSVNLGGTPSYALIAGGKIFVTVSVSGNTQLVALDQASGATVWGPVVIAGTANAAYDASTVFVVSDIIGNAGLMQAFDAVTGLSNWSTLLSGQYVFSSPPTAAHGFVFTGGAGSGGTLYAVDETNGAIAWTQSVTNGDSSAPAVSADSVYVTYPCNTYAFRPSTGELIWSNNTGCSGGGGATPVVANGVLYAPNGFATYNGSRFNAETGTLLGSYVADNPPAIAGQTGYFLQSGTLRAVSLSSNSVLWSYAGDGGLVTSPIVVNQYVFVGSSSGNLYALDSATGQQVWQMNIGSTILNGAGWGARMQFSGLSAGDGLLVVPAGNTLTAFTLSATP